MSCRAKAAQRYCQDDLHEMVLFASAGRFGIESNKRSCQGAWDVSLVPFRHPELFLGFSLPKAA
jgi:hypothetical protein